MMQKVSPCEMISQLVKRLDSTKPEERALPIFQGEIPTIYLFVNTIRERNMFHQLLSLLYLSKAI